MESPPTRSNAAGAAAAYSASDGKNQRSTGSSANARVAVRTIRARSPGSATRTPVIPRSCPSPQPRTEREPARVGGATLSFFVVRDFCAWELPCAVSATKVPSDEVHGGQLREDGAG